MYCKSKFLIITQPKGSLLWVTTGNDYIHLCTPMYFFQTTVSFLSPLKFWDYQPPKMGITPQNMPQTSNPLLLPTKSIVARVNQPSVPPLCPSVLPLHPLCIDVSGLLHRLICSPAHSLKCTPACRLTHNPCT